jgi:hypothetical protein
LPYGLLIAGGNHVIDSINDINIKTFAMIQKQMEIAELKTLTLLKKRRDKQERQSLVTLPFNTNFANSIQIRPCLCL